MKLSELPDGDYGYSRYDLFDAKKPGGTYLTRKKGNRIYGREIYTYEYPKLHRCSHGLEITTPENSQYFVALSTGECFAVKGTGKSSCIAGIENCFDGLRIKARAIWTPKTMTFNAWSKKWGQRMMQGYN